VKAHRHRRREAPALVKVRHDARREVRAIVKALHDGEKDIGKPPNHSDHIRFLLKD
jgi:hypothetical protein